MYSLITDITVIDEQLETLLKLNTTETDIQQAVVDKLNSIFVQRYPVYYMKEDAVRFGRSFSTLSSAVAQTVGNNYISPNSVRKWRETANENLDVLKKEIDKIPDQAIKSNEEKPIKKESLTVSEPLPVFSATINPLQRNSLD